MSIIIDLRAIYGHFAGTPFIQPRLPTSESWPGAWILRARKMLRAGCRGTCNVVCVCRCYYMYMCIYIYIYICIHIIIILLLLLLLRVRRPMRDAPFSHGEVAAHLPGAARGGQGGGHTYIHTYIYMYVYVCVYIHVCIYIYIYTHTYRERGRYYSIAGEYLYTILIY